MLACVHICSLLCAVNHVPNFFLQLPPGGGAWHDDLIVRGVLRRVVNTLVMGESLLLLEGVNQGRQALEAAGRLHQDSSRKWALW